VNKDMFDSEMRDVIQQALADAVLYHMHLSAWDAGFLIGMPLALNPVEIGMLILAFVLQACLQTAFCFVVVILASDNSESLENYEEPPWFCNQQLQSFEDYMHHSIGPLLSALVTLVWVLNVLKELRRIGDFLMGMWYLPRSKHTQLAIHASTGKVMVAQISLGRLVLMNINAAMQIAVASSLLVLGALWLASTTDLSDLLTNSVALQFIMKIDELLFQVLCSSKIKTMTLHMQPLRLPEVLVLPNRVPFRTLAAFFLWVAFFAAIWHFACVPNFDTMNAAIQDRCPIIGSADSLLSNDSNLTATGGF